MTGLKEIDGKWYQPCKVVVLSSNEKTNIHLDGSKLYYGSNYSIEHDYKHLYFLSDEEIKEGDIALVRNFDIPAQSEVLVVKEFVCIQDINYIVYEVGGKRFKAVKSYCKKIIAATDTSLKFGEDVPGVIKYKSLSQPSQQFIEKYREEYNKGNQITDVLVEVEIERYLKMVNGTLQKVDKLFNYEDSLYQTVEINTIKVNPKDNTITIRKQKDSWSREEVISLLYKYEFFNSDSLDTYLIDKWIKENL